MQEHGEQALGRISNAELVDACRVLAGLVHDEYPRDLTLLEIARTWGVGLSDAQLRAVEAVDRLLSRT